MSKQSVSSQQTANPPNGSGWKKFHGEMVGKMKVEKLKEAMKRREREQLETAIKDAQGLKPDHPALADAQMELDLLDVKAELQTAIDNKDPDAIRNVVEKIRSDTFYHTRLQPNLAEARRELDRLERMFKLSTYILDMDRKMMGELRRYHHPPEIVKEIIKGILLLFKKDEEVTAKWGVCQQLLQPNGPTGMNRRVLDFHINDVHPEVAARVLQILDRYELSQVQEVSSGAATFYVWGKGVLEEMGANIKVKPADVKRQKELFASPPPSPRRRRKQGSPEEPMVSPRKH